MRNARRSELYSDRVHPPAQTIRHVSSFLPAFGITRIARQTGLDVIGIPCFAAIRPNAKTLATSQGKGIDDDAAIASAVMEAIEFAVAERPLACDWTGSVHSLRAMGASFFDPGRLLQFGESFNEHKSIDWVLGHGTLSNRPVLVPRDIVRFDGETPDLPGVCQNTNGLASGNLESEAELHGLCELIERDAMTLWSLEPLDERSRRRIDLDLLDDPIIQSLRRLIDRAGLRLSVFDVTSDLGVPTAMALIGPAGASRHLEIGSGSGTHPNSQRAVIRAITEAAQSRVTSIAGARDDIPVEQYEQPGYADVVTLLDVDGARPMRTGLALGQGLGAARSFIDARLRMAGIAEPVCVSLGGDSYGIAVVRLLSEMLEDREANSNWRPGPRAVNHLFRHAA